MEKLEEGKVYASVKDYAAKHNVSVQSVYQKLKRGNLKGKKIGSYQLVLVE